MGDLDLKGVGTEVAFAVNADRRTVSQQGVTTATGISWPSGPARSIERALGNRTVIQTVLFERNDYLQFTFDVANQARQCVQILSNRRGDEHRLCANRHTFCRCR